MKNSTITHFEYKIHPGDTLTHIIYKLYGVSQHDPCFTKIKAGLLSLNPQIHNANAIKAGDTLSLTTQSHISTPLHSSTSHHVHSGAPTGKLLSANVSHTN